MKFVKASGGRMGRDEAKEGMFRGGEKKDKSMSLGFQTSNIVKSLAAVWMRLDT